MDRGDRPSNGPSHEFLQSVRDALSHLYDPAHLGRQPLLRILGASLPAGGDPAQNLRELLMDAIERLLPPEGTQDERDRRPYDALVGRYLGGLSMEEAAARLNVSARQFRREHLKALRSVAMYLWNSSREAGDATSGSKEGRAGAVQEEVEALGVRLEAISLADVLAESRAPAKALGDGYGIDLSLDPGVHTVLCRCDRELAKQALLVCLSAVVSVRPRAISSGADRRTLRHWVPRARGAVGGRGRRPEHAATVVHV